MACNCTVYDCLPVAPVIMQCGSSITTLLLADATETWKVKYEFNGLQKGFTISVVNNTPIVLPNNFNEFYNHVVEFIRADNTVYEETCFTLNTADLILNVGSVVNEPSAPLLPMTFTVEEIAADGAQFTVPSGITVWAIFPGNQGWGRNEDFTQLGNVITITNGSTVSVGQSLLLFYVNN